MPYAEGGTADPVLLSERWLSRRPCEMGMGVASPRLGDWGMVAKTESRSAPCSGIIGVMSGDERGAAEIAGETAGSMVGERMMPVGLRWPAFPDEELRTETSDDARLLACEPALLRSMWAGTLPRCIRCWDESCPPCSLARRAA